jgi:hypothetical protein
MYTHNYCLQTTEEKEKQKIYNGTLNATATYTNGTIEKRKKFMIAMMMFCVVLVRKRVYNFCCDFSKLCDSKKK